MYGKPFWQSKTNWFAFLVALLPALQLIIDENLLAEYPEYFTSGIALIIVLLRFFTKEPVKLK